MWLEGREEVAKGFCDYFQHLFTSDGVRDWNNELDCVDTKVTEEMNCDLLHPISLDEIKVVVFDLGALKSP